MGFVDISGILFSVWDKSHNPGANWSKLEHKQTTFVHMQSFIKGQTKLKIFFQADDSSKNERTNSVFSKQYYPPLDIFFIFEKSSCKNQVQQNGLRTVKIQFEID